MKKNITFIIFLLILIHPIFSQNRLSSIPLHSFNSLSLSDYMVVEIIMDGQCFIETSEENIKQLTIQQRGDHVNLSGLYSSDVVYVHASTLLSLHLSDAVTVKIKDTLKGDFVKINASGNTSVSGIINVVALELNMDETSNIRLFGSADKQTIRLSGTTDYDALHLKTYKTTAKMSGMSKASIFTYDLFADMAGFSILYHADIPNMKINITGNKQNTVVKAIPSSLSKEFSFDSLPKPFDSTDYANSRHLNRLYAEIAQIDAGKAKLNARRETLVNEAEKISHEEHYLGDTTIFSDIEITDDRKGLGAEYEDLLKDFGLKSYLPRKGFNGHWAGFELGINCYGLQNFNTKLPDNYQKMKQSFGNSIVVNFNLFDFSQRLFSNIGLTSGLGLSWNNYVFYDKSTVIDEQDGIFTAQASDNMDYDYKKSKLAITWIRIPLLLEWQNGASGYMKEWYISAGIVGSAKLGAHNKQKFYEDGSKEKLKKYDDFYLNPFHADIEFRIGFGPLRLFADISLVEMFQKGKGPELYPWNIGLSLLSF